MSCLIVNTSLPLFERQMIVGSFKIDNHMPSRPLNECKLEELSLSSKFKTISFSSLDMTVEAPAPRLATVVIKPRVRAVPQTNDIMDAKENVNKLLLLVNKSIKSPKIDDNERNAINKTVEKIKISMGSLTTTQELDKHLKQLQEIKRKLL